ncbi:MAG: type III PLP-dependent enzyme [Gemmatimonadaceae bacterium]|nr:type III PLP-dependent enzyme [Gemmatimonadaceae bacterium]
MISKARLKALAEEHGTPVLIIDHDELRRNFRSFRRHLPRVQPYFAVKAGADPAVVRTLFEEGSSFDVASMPEFDLVHENIKKMPARERQQWIWDKIIYANPIKPVETLKELDQYKPLVTFDNYDEIDKIKEHAPHAGLVLRLKVSNTGAMVELSSKFGAPPSEAADLILEAHRQGLVVEGVSFHVGSQTTNFANYVEALHLTAEIYAEVQSRGYTKMNLVDIGGGFPAPYDKTVRPFRELARIINSEINRLFPKHIEILAEPGRFFVATAGTAVSKIIGKSVRDGKPSYYLDDGVYHTYSGQIFDHCLYPVKAFKRGKTRLSAVFGPTCDAFDVISMAEDLPELNRDDLVYSEMIGAYTYASATTFNGFSPAKVVHVNL